MAEDAIRVVDRVADMADWDQTSFTDGLVPVWNAAAGKYEGVARPGDAFYVHAQDVADTTWTVTHNLGKFPSVSVVDSGGTWVVGDVTYVDANTLRVVFSRAFGGKAYCN